MKLVKCTCGGHPVRYPQECDHVENDELMHIFCDTCGVETLSYWDGRRAESNWNKLQKRREIDNE